MIKEIFSRRLDGLLSMAGRPPQAGETEAFLSHSPFLFALQEKKLKGDEGKEKKSI